MPTTSAASVTRIRWWGGYKAWSSPEPPESQPEAWHIGFWANQIEGIDQNETFPERMVWSLEIPAERIHFEPVGQLEFPHMWSDTCFVYEVQLEPEEWFHQVGYESNYDVFWISITAIYPADVEAANLWSWITRPHLWGNGAVMPAIMGDWPTYDERLFPGRIYPIENSLQCGWNQAYDMCFELLTEHPWGKWDQPFMGLRDWSYSEDQVSQLAVRANRPGQRHQLAGIVPRLWIRSVQLRPGRGASSSGLLHTIVTNANERSGRRRESG